MMESNRIEYKRELTETLEKEVIAFLNYRDGGVIYLGIDGKAGSVNGIRECDKVQLQIKDRLKNNILPSCLGLFDVIHEKRDDKDIIKITLASGSDKPYYLKKHGMSEKGCFIRIGSAAEPMPVRMIEELFTRRTRHSIGKIKSPRQDLTFEQLKIYYSETGFNLGDKFASNFELLTDDGTYNYAAYLLADRNGNSIQVAKYKGIDRIDLIESNEFGYCSLVKSCKQILDKLELENRTATKITSKERINHRLWDPVALREAVINAIIHNDYTNEAVPKFEIFDNRIEITSAGNIPFGIEQEEFFAGYSIPRNKILMRIFKDLDMVEYLGSGMPRILKAYSKEAYIFTANFIRTMFPASPEVLKLEKTETFSIEKTLETTQTTTQKIIEILRENPFISRSELAGTLKDITEDGIKYQLNKMKKQGIIHRIGADKGGYWEIELEKTETFSIEKATQKTTLKATQKTTLKATQKTTQKILDILRKNSLITRSELAKIVGDITEDGIKYQLSKMKKQGIIRRIGSDKGGYWEIVNIV